MYCWRVTPFHVQRYIRFYLIDIKVLVLWPSKPCVFLVGTHIAKEGLFKYRRGTRKNEKRNQHNHCKCD